MDQVNFRPLISGSSLKSRIRELGKQIRRDHGPVSITCICVLKGAFLFAADLVREIDGDIRLEFVQLNGMQSLDGSAKQITVPNASSIRGKYCLIVEDIIDTGHTLKSLIDSIMRHGPISLRSVVLLDKASKRDLTIEADYTGFSIPDEYVVGYGLDLQGRYSNLDHIKAYTP
jgi:hypoxanthine phosphoribosyltransferase